MSKSCVDSRRYSNKWNTQWWKCIYIYLEKIGGWLFTSGCPATSYQACLLQRLRYSNNASKFMCIICFITFRIAGTNSRIDRWNHDARNLLSAHFFSLRLFWFPFVCHTIFIFGCYFFCVSHTGLFETDNFCDYCPHKRIVSDDWNEASSVYKNEARPWIPLHWNAKQTKKDAHTSVFYELLK